MRQQGRSATLRPRSLPDRIVTALGARLPAWSRRMLGSLYGVLLRVVRSPQLTATLPTGERFRLLPRYRRMTWNLEEVYAFSADLHAGDVALDIGANLGAYTLLFAQRVGPSGRVLAFEPAPASLAGLRALVQANGFNDRVLMVGKAVSDRDGHATFLAVDSSGANRLAAEAGDGLQVETVTVDSICGALGLQPRLIKIDAEGAELHILRGARKTIAVGGERLRLYMEVHPQLWSEFGASREAIEAELAAQQLRVERIDGDPDIWNLEGVCLRAVKCGS